MGMKHVVPEKERKYLPCQRNVHTLVMLYAKRRGLTLTEGTYRLLRKGLMQEVDIPLDVLKEGQ
jgi:hypothetical protein